MTHVDALQGGEDGQSEADQTAPEAASYHYNNRMFVSTDVYTNIPNHHQRDPQTWASPNLQISGFLQVAVITVLGSNPTIS